jgi:hypothetical protein
MALSVYNSKQTSGTTAVADIAATAKKSGLISLPWPFSVATLTAIYPALSAKPASLAGIETSFVPMIWIL